ncbi:menaquinone biosynthesis decarboxylase [Alkalibacter mobilis]|uniref:menaquinone biosynthesis decarboxylase n=1 Tax=Alkalibacter mobilis TaxID=2787712 RepID=UPI00189CF1F0|nr:menaquinone biosynthesis decarboxylase [Alkalibacter mobilis]MBF7095662.1 menaquinone biosynthesis decarboxylase [Alkalibacter mobilis]
MAFKDLKEFMDELNKRGELHIVDLSVSSYLEITEITDRISKSYGPALLFKKVENSPYPVLINAMGTYKRMSLGLGADSLDEIGSKMEKYLNFKRYFSIKGLISSIPMFFQLLHVFPSKSKRTGPCQEVIDNEVDLSTLPVLHCWPEDAGPFFTLPLVFTKDRDNKTQNVGMYRMQVLDKTTTGMHWHKHKDGSRIYQSYATHNEKMPVSVALGCDPAITYASTAPLPKDLDEMMLAGWLRKSRVKMVKSRTNDIYVPADAEFVLEGYIDPNEDLVLEGPFGDHTGYYSLADFYPKFHVTCITHKKEPIYPATVVGKPPMEDCYMAKATERIFLPILKMQMPELVDLNLPLEGVFHNCAIISIKNNYPGCAHKMMNAIWGMGQMMYTKMIVIVDEHVDVQNIREVSDEVLKNVVASENLILSKGPLDALDHSSNESLFGTRLGIDATSSDKSRSAPASYKILSANKTAPFQGIEILKEAMAAGSDDFFILVDSDVNTSDLSTVMWKVFNNIDAQRDLVINNGKFGIDATKKLKEEGLKRPWPNDIVMSEEVKETVSKRWESYGFK